MKEKELAPIIYDVLKEYADKEYNLLEHEDRQDIGWSIATAIIKEMK